jgi:hypothetical protein
MIHRCSVQQRAQSAVALLGQATHILFPIFSFFSFSLLFLSFLSFFALSANPTIGRGLFFSHKIPWVKTPMQALFGFKIRAWLSRLSNNFAWVLQRDCERQGHVSWLTRVDAGLIPTNHVRSSSHEQRRGHNEMLLLYNPSRASRDTFHHGERAMGETKAGVSVSPRDDDHFVCASLRDANSFLLFCKNVWWWRGEESLKHSGSRMGLWVVGGGWWV